MHRPGMLFVYRCVHQTQFDLIIGRLIGEKERSLLASRTLSVRLCRPQMVVCTCPQVSLILQLRNWYRVDCASFRYFQTRLGLVPRTCRNLQTAEIQHLLAGVRTCRFVR